MKNLAIVGSGIAGLGAAYLLRNDFNITILESGTFLGGHTNTIDIPLSTGEKQSVDTGFIVFNEKTYPNLVKLFNELGVEYADSDMSFALYNTQTNLQWCSNGLNGLFAQRKNIFSPQHYKFLLEANRFNRTLELDLKHGEVDGAFADYLHQRKFSDYFIANYIIPMSAAVWSTPPQKMLNFPAATFARFFVNHGFLSLYSGLQWKYVVGGSRVYVEKIRSHFKGKVLLNTPVEKIEDLSEGVALSIPTGILHFDACLIATHADQALRMLAQPTVEQKRLLSPFQYEKNIAVLHSDTSVMQPLRRTWSSWNFKSGSDKSTVVYYMNKLQRISGDKDYFVSLNDFQAIAPEKTYGIFHYEHPLFDSNTEKVQSELSLLNNSKRLFFSGSYFRYGFHEDAYTSAILAAEAIKRQVL